MPVDRARPGIEQENGKQSLPSPLRPLGREGTQARGGAVHCLLDASREQTPLALGQDREGAQLTALEIRGVKVALDLPRG